MSRQALVLLAAFLAVGARLAAQQPVPFQGVSFGIDTTAADAGDIVRLVRAYLTGPGVGGTDAVLTALRGRFPDAARDIDAWWRHTAEAFATAR